VSEFGHLVERLEAIAEELDDTAFDLLREAVADGAVERPPVDRRLVQARRAIEKAAGILRALDEPPPSGP
jgi:predicted transcriptional regulator